jgi:orotidine-5'-phosphate decarboxylase
MTFIQKLEAAWKQSHSLLCIGLDPDISRLPKQFSRCADAMFEFCCAIVNATAAYACAFKPQIAYFSAQGAESQLEQLIAYIHTHYPLLPVILDAKRGDIGSTAVQYAHEAFERYRADAVTINPYLGFDTIEPYLAYPDKGVILLCRTSNAGGATLQMLETDGRPLYQTIASYAATQWNTNGQMGLVVGATCPEEITAVRRIVGPMPLLIPGIGIQGGEIKTVVKAGCTDQGIGVLINSSRAILYAASGDGFAEAARQTAQTMRDTMNFHRPTRANPG